MLSLLSSRIPPAASRAKAEKLSALSPAYVLCTHHIHTHTPQPAQVLCRHSTHHTSVPCDCAHSWLVLHARPARTQREGFLDSGRTQVHTSLLHPPNGRQSFLSSAGPTCRRSLTPFPCLVSRVRQAPRPLRISLCLMPAGGLPVAGLARDWSGCQAGTEVPREATTESLTKVSRGTGENNLPL